LTDESIVDRKLSRRQLIGAAAGGAAALGAGAVLAPKLTSAAAATPKPAEPTTGARAGPVPSQAQPAFTPTPTQPYGTPASWDYTADVVIVGAGCAGLTAALAAAEGGATTVLVVDENYDIGGKMICNGGSPYLGGGNSAQIAYGITDSPDLFFSDLVSPLRSFASTAINPYPAYTVPSSLPSWYSGSPQTGTHYVPRDMYRVIADQCVALWDWLLANGVQFTQTALPNTPPTTSGATWASGTARSVNGYWNGASSFVASAAAPVGGKGTAFARPLEATARAIGVQFLLNWKMTSVIREGPYSGNVTGITAAATGGRIMPGSTTPLQSYLSQGNITLDVPTAFIKANKAVIVCTGGSSSNVLRRREEDPRLTAVYPCVGDPYSFQTGDGEYAARRIGAARWATANETAENDTELTKATRLGAQYTGTAYTMSTSSPVFPIFRAIGFTTIASYGDFIDVNMAGVRFDNEADYNYPWLDAAMAANAASTGPDWAAGPIWSIFDSAALKREGWTVGYPYTDPFFFFEANDIPTLAQQINTNSFQTTPMNGATLQATITRYNGFVVAGTDTDFGKPTSLLTAQINTPPYYAAFHPIYCRDWYGGLHINTQSQVIDLDGNVIPHFYAAGEDAQAGCFHGMTKCFIFGRIAGAQAAQESQL